MDQEFLQSFAEIVREQVARQHDVKLEGLGVFRPEHQKQYQQQYQDGRVVMMPPKDKIEFVAESNWADAD